MSEEILKQEEEFHRAAEKFRALDETREEKVFRAMKEAEQFHNNIARLEQGNLSKEEKDQIFDQIRSFWVQVGTDPEYHKAARNYYLHNTMKELGIDSPPATVENPMSEEYEVKIAREQGFWGGVGCGILHPFQRDGIPLPAHYATGRITGECLLFLPLVIIIGIIILYNKRKNWKPGRKDKMEPVSGFSLASGDEVPVSEKPCKTERRSGGILRRAKGSLLWIIVLAVVIASLVAGAVFSFAVFMRKTPYRFEYKNRMVFDRETGELYDESDMITPGKPGR